MITEERINQLEDSIRKYKKKKTINKSRYSRCVFCVDDFHDALGISILDHKHNPHLIADGIVREAYQIKSGKKLLRTTDPYECQHNDWLHKNSIHVSDFIASTLYDIGDKKIIFKDGFYDLDPYDPRQTIPLLSNFEKMNFAMDEYLIIKKQWCDEFFKKYQNSKYMPTWDENLTLIWSTAKQFLKITKKEWFFSLDWKKYDLQYLELEKYSGTFSKIRNNL